MIMELEIPKGYGLVEFGTDVYSGELQEIGLGLVWLGGGIFLTGLVLFFIGKKLKKRGQT